VGEERIVFAKEGESCSKKKFFNFENKRGAKVQKRFF
jgi:hypothetical protein